MQRVNDSASGSAPGRPGTAPDLAVVPPPPRIAAPVMERAARVIRVVGHPLRLRLLEALEPGERNVTELVEAVETSQGIVSQQLAILRAEGVVGARREGARVYYRITEPKVSRILACIRECDLPELGGSVELALLEPDEAS